MRVLVANYRYFVSGGPEQYMFAVTAMLEGAGHEVVPFSARYARNRDTAWSTYFVDPIAGDDEIYFRDHSWTVGALTRGLRRAFYAQDVYDNVSKLAAAARPDVALVQHYLRKLSPSLLVALKQVGVPIVVRLSDFGMVCPEAHMLRKGRVCHACISHGLWPSIGYRCVQGSFAVSAVAAASMWFAKWRRYFDLIDYFISPSATLRDVMVAGGYDASRIVVLPTFVDAARFASDGPRDRSIVYVGRLSPEKGLDVLLDAYGEMRRGSRLDDVELIIAGEGEQTYASRLAARAQLAPGKVRLVGRLDADGVQRLLCRALVSVMPSICYDNLPNALIESLAAGTPVLASDLGSLAEAIRGTNAGLLFRPGDHRELAGGLVSLLSDADTLRRMSQSARELAQSRYSPRAHLAGLLAVFRDAREACSHRSGMEGPA